MNLELSRVGGNDTQSFVDEIFRLKSEYVQNDTISDSEFSLGNGTQDIIIQSKAQNIIDQTRN